MKDAQWYRKGHILRHATDGRVEDCKTINNAKRRSRALQMELDGALGRGSVRIN